VRVSSLFVEDDIAKNFKVSAAANRARLVNVMSTYGQSLARPVLPEKVPPKPYDGLDAVRRREPTGFAGGLANVDNQIALGIGANRQ
jgi:hypothetical protein